jgi:hypothetical protein
MVASTNRSAKQNDNSMIRSAKGFFTEDTEKDLAKTSNHLCVLCGENN